MVLLFIYTCFNLMLCHGKRGFLVKCHGKRGLNSKLQFLAPLAEGQRAIVMAWGRRASVRPFVRACVRKLFL